jgi:hypothetical protein
MRFITFSGEEEGLYGSYMYAHTVSQQGDNIVAVINLDEIGFANTTEGGRTICFVGPKRSMWIGDFVQTVSLLYRNQIYMNAFIRTFFDSGAPCDIQSFIDYGFDVLDVCDYDAPPWYHTQNDILDHVNWTYLTKNTKFILAVFAELVRTPIELQVIITKPYEGYVYFFNNPLCPLMVKYRNLGLRGATVILGSLNLNVTVFPCNDIESVHLCLNGITCDWNMSTFPYYQWTISLYDILLMYFNIIHYYNIHFLFLGRQSIEIYAYDTSGNVASDEMNIIMY